MRFLILLGRHRLGPLCRWQLPAAITWPDLSGSTKGAILLDGKRAANRTAPADGNFELSASLQKRAIVQIDQQLAPRSWEVEAELVAERQP